MTKSPESINHSYSKYKQVFTSPFVDTPFVNSKTMSTYEHTFSPNIDESNVTFLEPFRNFTTRLFSEAAASEVEAYEQKCDKNFIKDEFKMLMVINEKLMMECQRLRKEVELKTTQNRLEATDIKGAEKRIEDSNTEPKNNPMLSHSAPRKTSKQAKLSYEAERNILVAKFRQDLEEQQKKVVRLDEQNAYLRSQMIEMTKVQEVKNHKITDLQTIVSTYSKNEQDYAAQITNLQKKVKELLRKSMKSEINEKQKGRLHNFRDNEESQSSNQSAKITIPNEFLFQSDQQIVLESKFLKSQLEELQYQYNQSQLENAKTQQQLIQKYENLVEQIRSSQQMGLLKCYEHKKCQQIEERYQQIAHQLEEKVSQIDRYKKISEQIREISKNQRKNRQEKENQSRKLKIYEKILAQHNLLDFSNQNCDEASQLKLFDCASQTIFDAQRKKQKDSLNLEQIKLRLREFQEKRRFEFDNLFQSLNNDA